MFCSLLLVNLQIHCDVRGSIGPPCNAVGLVDRFFLGENHLYKNPVYKRTKVIIEDRLLLLYDFSTKEYDSFSIGYTIS